MMDDNIHQIEEGANTSSNAPPIRRCLTPRGQALANSTMESITASVSKLRRGDRPTIYMVPQIIRQVKEVAYVPQMVSIGPYHHDKSLQVTEENKLLYLRSFLSRNPNHRLEDYIKAMEESEVEARSCYSDNIDTKVDKYEFVKMMVLDACFIVEFFLRFDYSNKMGGWHKIKNDLEIELEKEIELFFQLGYFTDMIKPEEESRRKEIYLFFQLEDLEDPILTTAMVPSMIVYDMLLLENQIPFFVLQSIFMMACPVNLPHKLAEIALDLFDKFLHTNKEILIKDSYCHLLHLFHSHLILTPTHGKERNSTVESVPNKNLNLPCNLTIESVPNKNLNLSCNHTVESILKKFKNILRFFSSSNKPQLPIINYNPSSLRVMLFPCATELQHVGVKFKKNEKLNNILNVKFSHGVLEIMPFVIHYHTDTLFRNLVAFEQCYLKGNLELHFFTTYFVFMNFLVNTSKDVALLHRNGIIFNLLENDDEVANLFNRLCIGSAYSFEGSYLSALKDDVQKHCKNRWNMWWASLKHDYFSNPWSVISLIAASILLLVTITQTFFTVFPHYGPQS